jgi:hypothetical protein
MLEGASHPAPPSRSLKEEIVQFVAALVVLHCEERMKSVGVPSSGGSGKHQR